MTTAKTNYRPQRSEEDFPQFLNVKEAAIMLGVSVWTIYKLITSDSSFPAHNIGLKKKWVVSQKDLISWMESKTKKRILEKQKLPTGLELLKVKGEKND